MSGIFTIGSTGDFLTMQSAINAVETNGIAGNITFYLQAGTYDEQVEINGLNQIGAFNISFEKAAGLEIGSVILTNSNANSTNNYIVRILDSKNISFSGLKFTSQPTYGRTIYIRGTTYDIDFTENEFIGINITSSPDNYSLIYMYSDTESGRIEDIVINQNTFYYGGYQIQHSSGTYTESLNLSNIEISDNIHNSGFQAIYLQRSNYAEIFNNQINNSRSGITLSEGKLPLIYNNLVKARMEGINISSVSFLVTTQNAGVYNNQITVTGENDAGTAFNAQATGLSVSSCNYAKIYHNSIVLKTESTYYSYAAVFNNNPDGNLKNNQILSYGNAHALYLNYSDVEREDYNNVFSNGIYTVKKANDNYITYDDYRVAHELSNNSMSLDPFFHNHGNYELTSDFFTDKGTPIGFISTDYFGNPRSVTTPDIGAIERQTPPTSPPMSGVYSIGSSHALYNLDYALNSLAHRGMSGAVHFLLEEPQTGTFRLRNIPGASETNKLTIYGTETNTISGDPQFAEDNYLIQLNRANFVTFDGVHFENLNPTFGNMVVVNGYNQHIRFDGCAFNGFFNQGNSANRASFKADSNVLLRNIEFDSCTFNNNSYGIYASQSYNIKGDGFSIYNCQFNGNFGSAYVHYVNNTEIYSNQFDNFRQHAIYLNALSHLTIENNKLYSPNSTYGINLGNISGEIDGNGNYSNFVANNIIKIDGPANGGPTAIWLGGSHFDIMHNSIKVSGDQATGIYAYNTPPNSRIINNAIESDDWIFEFSYNVPETFTMDYNCFYTESYDFCKLVNRFDTLQDFQEMYPQWNQNSFQANPYFTETMESDSPWIKDKSFFTNRVTTDYFGNFRDFPYDIGAHEIPFYQNYDYPAFDDGIVTIGVGKEYETLDAAFAAIEKRGFFNNADIIFQLFDETFTGKFELNHIPRNDMNLTSDSDATLIIQPGGTLETVTINAPVEFEDNDSIIKLIGANRVKFENIDFIAGTTLYNSNIIRFGGVSELITFENCSFIGENSAQTTYALNSYREVVNKLRIENCHFEQLAYGVYKTNPSYYYGGNTNSIRVTQSHFDTVSYPVYITSTDNVRISQNVMNNFLQAIFVNGSARNLRIQQNKMYTADISGGYSDYTLIYLSGINGSEEVDRNYVHGNILVCLNSAPRTLNGIHIYNSQNMFVDNNTILLEQTNWYGIALSVSYPDNITVRNNVLAMDGLGKAFYSSSADGLTMSNNAFYTLGERFASVGNDDYATFEDFQSETTLATGSYYVYPFLNEDGYVQSEFLKNKGNEAYFLYDVDGAIWNEHDIGANVINATYSTSPLSSDITVGVDYSTLQEAIDVAARRGISGTIQIIMNDDTNGENFVVRPFPLSSPDNQVIIVSSNRAKTTLAYNASGSEDNYIFGLRGVNNFHIENFELVTENVSYQTAIHFQGVNRNIEIKNCDFEGVETSTVNSDRAFISIYDAMYDNLKIHLNSFDNGGTALYIYGKSNTSFYNDLRFWNNGTFNMHYGVYAYNIGSADIIFNSFNSIHSRAIEIQYQTGQLEISMNSIAHKSGSGIYLNHINTPDEVENRVYDNYVKTFLTTSASNNNMYIANAKKMNIANNTFRFMQNNASGNSRAFEKGTGCSDMVLLNNIFYNNKSGAAAVFNGTEEVTEIDYNLFYAVDQNKVIWGSQNYTSDSEFPETGNFSHSIIADPLFTNDNTCILENQSPAIDAGTYISYITLDVYGGNREIPYDIGAWERQIPDELSIPQNVTIIHNANDHILEFSWDAVDGAQYYIIEAADSPTGQFTQVATSGSPSFEVSTSGVPVKRFYRIIATTGSRRK
jgi:hypothetical protein